MGMRPSWGQLPWCSVAAMETNPGGHAAPEYVTLPVNRAQLDTLRERFATLAPEVPLSDQDVVSAALLAVILYMPELADRAQSLTRKP